MIQKMEDTYRATIYLSGPMEVAEQIVRGYCKKEGLCVTITPTKFIYTGGEEVGYTVGVVNYPRFPDTPEGLRGRAVDLMLELMEKTHQNSALLVDSEKTTWISDREETKR